MLAGKKLMFNKKIFLAVFFTVLGVTVYAQGNKFTDALKTCSSFSGSDKINMLQTTVDSSKRISGWVGDRCIYNEKVSFMGIESNVVCKFTQAQIKELASVIEAYELLAGYSGESPDFSSLDTAQNNPVAKVWSKYMQDPQICTVTTSSGQTEY